MHLQQRLRLRAHGSMLELVDHLKASMEDEALRRWSPMYGLVLLLPSSWQALKHTLNLCRKFLGAAFESRPAIVFSFPKYAGFRFSGVSAVRSTISVGSIAWVIVTDWIECERKMMSLMYNYIRDEI
jgi:hypothetical protein